jgi:hypothetical protein
MGFDMYFYKFDGQGKSDIPYQDTYGDVYTVYSSGLKDDWDAFKRVHPEIDIDKYEIVSSCGSGKVEFARKTRTGKVSHPDRVTLSLWDIPSMPVTVRRVPVKEVGYFRYGYGGYMLGERGAINVGKLWKNLEKQVNPDNPVVTKQRFLELMKLPEFKELATLVREDGIKTSLDYDVVYLSW